MGQIKSAIEEIDDEESKYKTSEREQYWLDRMSYQRDLNKEGPHNYGYYEYVAKKIRELHNEEESGVVKRQTLLPWLMEQGTARLTEE